MSVVDPNQDILEKDGLMPAPDAGEREWPGVARDDMAGKMRFPGEDGGKSLAEIAQRDLNAALQLLAERAQYITGATGSAIALGTSEGMLCRASAGSSAPEVGSELQVSSGLSGESVRTRRLLRCDDAQTDPRVNRESCEALGIASVVVMPMVDGGEVIGVFELFSDRAHAFEDRDIDALERMGAMVRTALEQAAHPAPAVEEVKTAEEAPVLDLAAPADAPVVASAEAKKEKEEEENDGEEDRPILEETSPNEAMPVTLQTPAESGAPTKTDHAAEPDPGEMVRDAAERTAAAKASLFEAAGIGHEPRPERFAFHMRVPPAEKPAPGPVEEEGSKAAAAGDDGEPASWSAPRIEEEPAEVAADAGVIQAGTLAGLAVSSFGAAAAPALEKNSGAPAIPDTSLEKSRPEKASGAAQVVEVAPDKNVAPPPAARVSPVEPSPETRVSPTATTKPVARPASAEGRSRTAVSQLRRCEACGFPVSEGRRYCLDCEKKPDKTPRKAEARTETAAVATPAAPAAKAEPVAEAPSAPKIDRLEAPAAESKVEAKAEEQPANVAKIVAEPAKPEPAKAAVKPEPAKAEPASTEEPPMPHFMVTPPDHYESWIVSHMYSAVAIAVVLIGIVVYLLSR